jgi:hypothetical protein
VQRQQHQVGRDQGAGHLRHGGHADTGLHHADQFIAEAGELLTNPLGPLARCGVALHELHPESYGYDGVTQFDFYRREAARR